jgi:predicted MFS family arabinose efflux permease
MSTTPISNTLNPSMSQNLRDLGLIVLLALIQFSFVVDYILILPLGPSIMKAFEIKPAEYGVLISVYTLSAAVAGFFSSFIIDRFGRKQALLFCFIFFLAGDTLCVLANQYYFLIIARVFSGAFGGILSCLVMIYLGDAFPVSKIGKSTSSVLIANGIATIVGVPAALYFSQNATWKSPFMILLAINISIFILCCIFLPNIKKPSSLEGKRNSLRLISFIKNPNFVFPVIFMTFLTLAGGATILPFISTFVSKNYAFGTDDLAMMFFYGGLSALVINFVIGSLIDKFGKQNVFLLLNFISMIPLILLTTFPFPDKIQILIVTTSFFCFSTAKTVSGLSLVNSIYPSEHRGRFVTITNSIQLLTGSAATILCGTLLYTENNVIMNFDLLGVIGICATIISIFAAFVVEA